jgi:hypothetical protein
VFCRVLILGRILCEDVRPHEVSKIGDSARNRDGIESSRQNAVGRTTQGVGRTTKGVGVTTKGVDITTKGVGITTKGVDITIKGVGITTKGVGRTEKAVGIQLSEFEREHLLLPTAFYFLIRSGV